MTDTTQDFLDMATVRARFPALANGWLFADNAGGSQTLQGAMDRIVEFLTHRDVQIGGSYEISQAAAQALRDGRQAAQTLVNANRPEEIVFGPSSTALMQTLAAGLRGPLQAGDEIVVTHADHESNIGPWLRLQDMGVVIKVWPCDPATGRLALSDLDQVMTDRTRLVCVHHVSNLLGEINDIAAIARFVHARGAQICVDGVAYAPHRAIDVQAWDVDYYVFSLYKCYGPHLAVLYGKYDLLHALEGQYHYFYGADALPGKLEPGNPNYELAYSTTAVVDHLCQIGGAKGRAGVEQGFAAIAAQEQRLTDRLLAWLSARDDCEVIGQPVNTDNRRVPTIAFRCAGLNSAAICAEMDQHRIAIRHGDFHSRRLAELMGQTHDGGVLRVSMVHYNTMAEVDRLTAALGDVLDRLRG